MSGGFCAHDPLISRRSFGMFALAGLGALACGKRTMNKLAGHRIVSVSPAMTETLFAIEAGSLLVGRSKQCDYPPAAKEVPAVCDFAEPNLEAILARSPTLVVGPAGPATARLATPLKERGIDTYFRSPESVNDIHDLFRTLGERTSRGAQATATWTACFESAERARKAVESLPRKRIAMLLSTKPIYLAGILSFPGDLVSRAGADNVANARVAYPAVGIEQLAGWDPDVLIDATNMAGGNGVHAGLPGFGLLRAIREKNVVVINDDSVLRPGPRFADGIRRVASALHPDAAGALSP